jgi:hypothetical protein
MLTITGTSITSDETAATAEFREHAAADGRGAWVCSLRGWDRAPALTGRLLTRDQAITAMTIAEELARPEPDRVLIASLETELLT